MIHIDTYYSLEVDDKILLKSLSTGYICEISTENYRQFQRNNSLNELIEQINEQVSFKFEELTDNHDILSIFIVTTMNCNLTCSYCFENDKDRNVQLSCKQENIAKVIDYIIYKLNRLSYKKLDICFTGGEPLFNYSFIEKICSTLEKLLTIPITYPLITNGTIITRKIMQFLNKYKFSIQISFDGNEKYHNQERKNRIGQGPYKRIILNMETLLENCPNVFIQARINLSSRNYHTVYDLFKDLNSYQRFKNFILYFDFIAIKSTSELFLKTDEKVREVKKLLYYLNKYDIPHVRNLEAAGYCMFKNNDSFTIHADGSIYKCYSLVGDSAFQLGSIDKLDSKLLGTGSLCEDRACPYYELCYGGCPYNSYVEYGKMTKDCQYQLIDIIQKLNFLYKLDKSWTFQKVENMLSAIQTIRYDTSTKTYLMTRRKR